MIEIQRDLFGNHTPVEAMIATLEEACTIPRSVASCPICKAELWIESIDEVEELEDGSLSPSLMTLTCETEPSFENDSWIDWREDHYATPYIDWLPVEEKVLAWLQQTEQQKRVELIWERDRNG